MYGSHFQEQRKKQAPEWEEKPQGTLPFALQEGLSRPLKKLRLNQRRKGGKRDPIREMRQQTSQRHECVCEVITVSDPTSFPSPFGVRKGQRKSLSG
jgi:hypothetical protein